MCYYIASYLKSQFCRPGGVFWPFLDPREAKKGKKKVNRQTPDKKNHRQKKLTNTGYFAEKKSWLYDNQPHSYIRLLSVVFFVPTRYVRHLSKLNVSKTFHYLIRWIKKTEFEEIFFECANKNVKIHFFMFSCPNEYFSKTVSQTFLGSNTAKNISSKIEF